MNSVPSVANKELETPQTSANFVPFVVKEKRQRFMKLLRSKLIIRCAAIIGLIALWLAWWIGWGAWPAPVPKELPWRPDVILVLGGGNDERPRETIRLHKLYPDVPVLVTGDSGMIYHALLKGGVPESVLRHETQATSTIENAELSQPILDQLKAQKIVLVTNWFHVPRSLAVFDRYQPEREFAASFEAKPEKFDNWHRYASRRERMAAIMYVFRYRIWSF